jgi:hypothetical protein
MLVVDIAKEDCRKLYEKRLVGLGDELTALYKEFDEHSGRA